MADLLLVKMGYVQDTCEKQGFEVDPISVVEHFTLGRYFGIQQKNVDISGLVGRSVSEPSSAATDLRRDELCSTVRNPS